MHTPSNAWVRVRSPSTTFTATRTVSPGAKSGTPRLARQAGDLLGLVTLDDVHRWGPSVEISLGRGRRAGNRAGSGCRARPTGQGAARA